MSLNDFKQVDFGTGEGLKECFESIGQVKVIINCAAISKPVVCEENPELAEAVNVPRGLVEIVQRLNPEPLFVHFSTDQVYDGSRSDWKESDPVAPINQYGRTKAMAEELIQTSLSNYIILRSSIIFGAAGAEIGGHRSFIEFVIDKLMKREPGVYFSDEFRCPVYAHDIYRVVKFFVDQSVTGDRFQKLFNLGGRDRLSRLDMAKEIAGALKEIKGVELNESELISSGRSSEVVRKVKSPLDISMDISNLHSIIDFKMSGFRQAVCACLEYKSIELKEKK